MKRRAGLLPWRVLAWGLVPIVIALAVKLSGLDLAISDHYYSVDLRGFPARANDVLEIVGHKSAKSILLAAWFVLLGGAVAAHFDPATGPWRRVLWASVIGMALGPTIVSILKSITSFPCPWDLHRYAGFVEEAARIFVAPRQAGQCFPAGHSAGGFSLFAVSFGLRVIGRPAAARRALAVALTVGIAFSYVRVIQGAHFVSHTLWSAGIDWICAGLPFCLMSDRRSLTLSALDQDQQARNDEGGADDRAQRQRLAQKGPGQQHRDDDAALVDEGHACDVTALQGLVVEDPGSGGREGRQRQPADV